MVLTLLPTAAFAAGEIDEQFTLAPGGTYYFDLSAMGIPGTVNDALPDKTMRYVPFTYAGTVDSYKLTSEMATTEEYAQQSKYAHSLFIADFAVTHEVSWDNLNAKGLIFGKNYTAGGVSYTLRAPSVGSDSAGSGDSQHGTPQSNEWDRILDKNDGYIKNWSRMHSWGQDISRSSWTSRAVRGYYSARYWNHYNATNSNPNVGFRPVLEVLNPDTLGSVGLKVVTLDLNGGKLGGSSDAIQIIVKTDSEFTAPASGGLNRPDGDTGNYFNWLGSDGKLYAPYNNVPADVTKLTAQFAPSSHSVTITTDTLPEGMVGEAYSQILTATGTTPITWSIDGGNLPADLSLNKDTGEISGTPTAAGTSTFTVKAENSVGSDTKELSITITKDAPPAHEHSYGDWRKDGTSHWHECTDDDCPNREESINDKAAHVYDDDADTTCNVCDYDRSVTPPAPTEFIVTFDAGDGTPSVGGMTTTNQKLASLPSASRSGSYSFDGWYTKKNGGTNVTTATVFHANTTVYAHWTYTGGGGGSYNPPVTYYTLRFETGGGSDIPSVQGTYNTYIDLTQYVPTWRGHTFTGWYSERSLTNKVSGVYLTKDMTVYAGWRVTTVPQTGDSSVLGLWGFSLCTSLAGCLALTTWQVRRRRQEKSLQSIEK